MAVRPRCGGTVDQPDGGVPADRTPVGNHADPAARLAVVVDRQGGVDPLAQLVKRPWGFTHAAILTLLYDSVN
jgi:hypothetical protein